MGDSLSYIIPACIGLAFAVWAVILIPAWARSAERRGGVWSLEGLMFICGPMMTLAIALYPATDASSGPFPMINRYAGYAAAALSLVAILSSLQTPRRGASGLITAVLMFYAALWLSALAGVVPAFPEPYWTTPLMVFAFLLHGGYSREWLLRTTRIAVRIILILSFAAMVIKPDIAFNLEEARTVFGVHRLQGILTHPNGFSALMGFGLLLEFRARSRVGWKLLFLAGIVLAQSTTGYIAVVMGILLMQNGLSKFLRGFAYVGAVVALGTAALGGVDWLISFLPDKVDTLTGRTVIWSAALQGFQLGPIFGYGPTLLDIDFRGQYLPNFDAAAQAHNQWVQSLGAEGILGVSSLAILTLVMLAYAFRARARDGLSLALVATLIIRGMTETPLRPSGFGLSTLMFVVTLAVLVAHSTTSEGAKEEVGDDEGRPELVQA